ncbi:MAG TPA: heme-binding protein [Bryobacteraceae bacterium]|nr:heme-binding protein [Bryobacteraceae bacterium]
MRKFLRACAFVSISLLPAFSATAQTLADRKALPLATARKMAEAAETFAMQNNWKMVICLMDEGGNLIYLERMDGSPLGSIGVAQEKALSSAKFSSPTKNFEDAVAKGGHNMLRLGVMPFEGGLPIMVSGRMIGAIGVSGGSAAQDGQVAKAAADWLAAALK